MTMAVTPVDLTQILTSASSTDQGLRRQGESQLKSFEGTNLPAYLVSLCHFLGDERKEAKLRQLAGLCMKNTLVTKDDNQKKVLAHRWLQVPEHIRASIRNMLCAILGTTEKTARSTAALAIGKIAAIEIPKGGWQDLIDKLVAGIRGTNPNLRESSFEALGYVCEECPEQLKAKSSIILGAIATGMKPEEKNDQIKLAATQALANSLEFARTNFTNESDRGKIMQMVFGAIKSPNEQVRVHAYQCLVEIAHSYYEYLNPWMLGIFELTAKAITKEVEPVGLQAIEFWSTICEVEMDIQDEYTEAQEKGTKPKRELKNFARVALEKKIVESCLLECLTKQSEALDDDTWDRAMAAGTCLSLFAQATTNHVIDHVVPFVRQHINHPNWRLKEAATLAFGCILEGPEKKKLEPYVLGAFPLLLDQMKDESALVKDTAAWTIGKICNLLPETIKESILPRLMKTLVDSLTLAPKIACNVCWAIHNLGEAVEGSNGETSSLSKYFSGLLKGLLTVTERPDVHESNLLTTSYEAINILIHSSAKDMYPVIAHLLPTFMGKLKKSLEHQGLGPEEREKQFEVQGLLCATLQVAIQKLSESHGDLINKCSSDLMRLFLAVLNAKSSTVLEEALMAIGALANHTKQNFAPFVPPFKKFLLDGLKAIDQVHLCIISTGVVSDVARSLELKFGPLADEVMRQLLQNLQSSQIDRSVKPHIISTMGDVALAIGGYFDRYINPVMKMLTQASMTVFKPEELDQDNVEYLNQLRYSIVEAYTGILNSLGADNKADVMLPYVDKIFPFIDLLAGEKQKTQDLHKATLTLIGDLAHNLGPKIKPLLHRASVNTLIMSGGTSNSNNLKGAATYAKDHLKPLFG